MPESVAEATVRAVEFDVNLRRKLSFTAVSMADDTTVTAGRGGDVILGMDPRDDGVSRLALSITRSAGWQLSVQNRNGAVVQPWGQAPVWVEAQASWTGGWPRVGVRLIGSNRSVEHWVLLQGPQHPAPIDDAMPTVPGQTHRPTLPKPLTPGQAAAVRMVFREYLAWPPVSGAAPVPLAAAANRLGISSTALQERLSRVQDRAYLLGLHQQIGVSDPGYVQLLVRHGYIG